MCSVSSPLYLDDSLVELHKETKEENAEGLQGVQCISPGFSSVKHLYLMTTFLSALRDIRQQTGQPDYLQPVSEDTTPRERALHHHSTKKDIYSTQPENGIL